jgi:hypothetical protein
LAQEARSQEALVKKFEQQIAGQKIDCEFFETPLKDILAYVTDATKIPFHFDPGLATEINVSTDNPNRDAISLKQVTVRELLPVILGEHGFSYKFSNQACTVVRKGHDKVHKYYILGSILSENGTAGDMQHVVELVSNMCPPDSWTEKVSPCVESIDWGTILPPAIYFEHSWTEHARIERLLRGLHRLSRDFQTDPRVVATPGYDISSLDAIRGALDKPSTLELDGTLADFAAALRDRTSVNVVLDSSRLADISQTAESKVRTYFENLTWQETIRQELASYNIGYYLTPNIVHLTSAEESQRPEHQAVKIFPIYDLMPADAQDAAVQLDRLANFVRKSVGPATWRNSGGNAYLQTWSPPALIVQGDVETLLHVERAVADLRKLKELHAAPK